MSNFFGFYEGASNQTFRGYVANSIDNGNEYSVLTWSYNSGNALLNPNHVAQQQTKNGFIYELYYVDANQGALVQSVSNTSAYITCVRYKETPEYNDGDIRMHEMDYSTFAGMFGADITNDNIYTWHGGSDAAINYYWYSYPYNGGLEFWYIIDGDLPFRDVFPQMYSIDDAPNTLWKIIDGNLPHKTAFPQMYSIDDAPNTLWKIIDGNLPFKSMFPKMYGIGSMSKLYKGNRLIKKIYLGDTKIKAVYNGDTKIF